MLLLVLRRLHQGHGYGVPLLAMAPEDPDHVLCFLAEGHGMETYPKEQQEAAPRLSYSDRGLNKTRIVNERDLQQSLHCRVGPA